MANHAGLPVLGYKPQSDDKVSFVNHNKMMEETILRVLDQLRNDEHGLNPDQRWLAIGRTHIEEGFMAINRAIFRPGRVELPDPTST